MRKIEVAASITTADFGNLYRVVRKLERAGVDRLHLDVMDGHFVPNITFGPDVVAAVRRLTDLPLDAHLMISQPARYLERFIAAGADTITFHYEIEDSAHGKHATLARIRDAGRGAGLAISPNTPAKVLANFADDLSLVIVMTVEPGFGGQAFMADQMPKVRQVREAVKRHGGEIWIQVDGGVSASTIEQCAEAGADVFVAGSAVYGAEDAAAAVDELRALASAHAH